MSALGRVPDALRAYRLAEARLVRAVERAYPIGAIVSATIGNARIRGTVVAHCGTGYYRGYIEIENERTGKKRCFYVADRSTHDVEVEYAQCNPQEKTS